jgi:hypothetical protein
VTGFTATTRKEMPSCAIAQPGTRAEAEQRADGGIEDGRPGGSRSAVDKIARWRIVDLCQWGAQCWGVSYSETGMLRMLWSLDPGGRPLNAMSVKRDPGGRLLRPCAFVDNSTPSTRCGTIRRKLRQITHRSRDIATINRLPLFPFYELWSSQKHCETHRPIS